MKRSEMLDALAWYLEEKYDLGYRASEQILDFLERQGMQPPPYTFKQKVVNNPTGNTISVTNYEWEDEQCEFL
jgi:hypothetical protein